MSTYESPHHWVRKPWPEDRQPTPDEWIDWFLTAPRDQQYAEAAMSIEDASRAIRCLILHVPQRVRPDYDEAAALSTLERFEARDDSF